MKKFFFIRETRTGLLFAGCNPKPIWCDQDEKDPVLFDSEQEALDRMSEEVELWGKMYIAVEIVPIYLF